MYKKIPVLITDISIFAIEIDKIYLVVDRDKKSFTEDQYVDTLKKLKKIVVFFMLLILVLSFGYFFTLKIVLNTQLKN